MKMAKFLKALFALGVIAACAGALAACSGSSGNDGTSGVAATVTIKAAEGEDGTTIEIPEEKVTTTIANVREQSGLKGEAEWANFLNENGMTPESVREQIVDSLVDQELVKAGAESLDISIESTEVDTYVESMKANFDSDEAWSEALQQAGFTEEGYRQNIESSLLQQRLTQHFQDAAEVTDKEVLESAKTYASYYDGAKRSSHILFGVDDTSDEAKMKEAREKAQKVLDQIKNDGLDFAEAAKNNSTDTASAEKGGDVGWDVLNSFVGEYTDALEELDKGEVSGLVESQYGIHIIKVTDVFNAPDEVKKLSDLPEDFQSTIKDMAKSMKANDDYTAWLDEQRKAAEITKNPMPANAPYNIDLSKYKTESASGESASGEAADGDNEDEAATADGEEIEVVEGDEADEGDAVEEEVKLEDASASAASASAESASSASASAASAEAEPSSSSASSAAAE